MRGQDADGREDRCTDQVERQMDDGRLLGFPTGTDAGKHGRDTGTDVLTKEHIDRTIQADQTASGKCLQDTDRCAGRLNDRREECTGQNAQ